MTDTTTTTRPKLLDWKLGAGVVLVLALLAASLMVGQYDILGTEDGWEMFRATRVPRTIALVLAGAAMAMCGLVMQLITQNRFVEPTTTGTTEWAGLGLLLVMIVAPESSLLTKMTIAVITAFLGTMVFFAFLRRVTLKSSIIVPLPCSSTTGRPWPVRRWCSRTPSTSRKRPAGGCSASARRVRYWTQAAAAAIDTTATAAAVRTLGELAPRWRARGTNAGGRAGKAIKVSWREGVIRFKKPSRPMRVPRLFGPGLVAGRPCPSSTDRQCRAASPP